MTGLSQQQHQQSTPSPWATVPAPSAVPLQPLHSGAAKPASVAAAPVTVVPAADKYSALAELESVFSAMSGPSAVNWDGGSGPGTRSGTFGSNLAQPVMSSGFGYGGTGHAMGPPPSYASLGPTTGEMPLWISIARMCQILQPVLFV